MVGAESVARHFPFRIGRSSSADFRVEDTGVWDNHLTLSLVRDESIRVKVEAGALVTVNGEQVSEAGLRNGDIIGVGAAQLQFALSPTAQKTLAAREIVLWMGLAAI